MATGDDSLPTLLTRLSLCEKSAISLKEVEENYVLDLAIQNG